MVEVFQLNFRRPINNVDFNRYIDISERSQGKRGLANCYHHGNCVIIPKRTEIVFRILILDYELKIIRKNRKSMYPHVSPL